MVGLDPTIQKPLKFVDPRVKPEDDGCGRGKIVINICLRRRVFRGLGFPVKIANLSVRHGRA